MGICNNRNIIVTGAVAAWAALTRTRWRLKAPA